MIVNGYKLDGSDNDRIRMFLSDSENIMECDRCPYQADGWPEDLPCGQQNCWVSVVSDHLSGGSEG